MKYFLYIILYLNIYTTFLCPLFGQNYQLSIKGEDTIPKALLDSIDFDLKFKNYQTLKAGTETIQNTLQNIGYIESELKSIKKENDSSFIATYYFGKRYKEIRIYYSNIDFSKKELLNVSSTIKDDYFILPFLAVESSLQKLSELKTKDGNTFARLHLQNITKSNNLYLSAQLVVSQGSIRTLDKIIIKGYDKFPKSFLRYYAGIKTGNSFSKENIIEQSKVLNNLGFVNNIKPPEVLFQKDSTTVYFYLKKQKNNLFDGILGFSTNDETQKLILNGYLNLELNNNLNFGETFILNYKADGNEQQNFRTKVSLPYILKTPFGLELELQIFKRDSTFVTTEQQARINYQVNPLTNSYIGYKAYESSNLLDEVYEDPTVDDYNSKFLITGFSFVKYQDIPLFFTKSRIALNLEIGSRELNKDSETQFRISGALQHIFNLNFKNSIFLKNSTRFLTSDTYLTNELFRFGGINSIRGFNENSIDASFFSVLNSEYRYQFNDNIYIHSIIDVAYFENQILDLKEKLYSFGLGFGLQTNAGIIKVNLANGNTENQDFSFSSTKIHLSISSSF